jgi:hypothetical protein
MAIRQRTPRITFESAAGVLDTFGCNRGARNTAAWLNLSSEFSWQRFFSEPIRNENTPAVIQRARFNFMAEARIWYSRDPDQKVPPGDYQHVIVLSDEFYREIFNHPIPTDLEAAKVLSGSPAAPPEVGPVTDAESRWEDKTRALEFAEKGRPATVANRLRFWSAGADPSDGAVKSSVAGEVQKELAVTTLRTRSLNVSAM